MRISDLEFRRVLFRSAQPHQSVRPVSQAVAILIDARGLKCPWPALRLARAVRQAGGGCFDLIAEDPAAQRDIPRLAAENGWQIEAFPADPPLLKWRIIAPAKTGRASCRERVCQFV